MPPAVPGGNVWKKDVGAILLPLAVAQLETGMVKIVLGVQVLAGVSRMDAGDILILAPAGMLPGE